MPEDVPDDDEKPVPYVPYEPPLSPTLAARRGRDIKLGEPGAGMREEHKENAEAFVDTREKLKRLNSTKVLDAMLEIVENKGVEPKVRADLGLGLLKLEVGVEAPQQAPKASALDVVVDLLTKRK
jgi:hypothetical protein